MRLQVLEGTTAVALSALICYVGSQWAVALDLGGASIPIITALTVLLATLVPNLLQPLVASGEGLAAIIMSVGHRSTFFTQGGAVLSLQWPWWLASLTMCHIVGLNPS